MVEFNVGRWDLSELVKNSSTQALNRKIKNLEKESKQFEKHKPVLNQKIPPKKFLQILGNLEKIYEKTSIIGGYASLAYAADTQSDESTALMTKVANLSSEISNRMLFFDLWWKRGISEKNAQRLIKESGQLANYLKHKRLLAKYSLSEPEEKIINTLEVTGPTALVKLYDKITNAFEYEMKVKKKKKKYTREELTNFVRSSNFKTRELAYKTLLNKFHDSKGVLGEIYQNIVLNWKNEGIMIRGFKTPISIRNITNDVDGKTIQTLLEVCKKNAPAFQKFFVQKSKILGLKKLRRYDIYAPSPSKRKEKIYPYSQSVRMVFDALNNFSPKLGNFARKVFDEKHIDSSIRLGKRDGAFCSTISPKITPYVLVNFTGKIKDVFTLSHELGHAIHSQAASDKSILVQEAPLPLAETASTFSELLLYQNLEDKFSKEEKKEMLLEKIDDFYATIMRQAFFTLFEDSAHEKIAKMATVDELSKTYIQNLKEQFGNSVTLSNNFSIEWCAIPHFFHTPFYCYAYSFGNLLSLSLFQRYLKEGADFVPIYNEILSTGGTKKPEELLEEYGFDIRASKFWQDGFDYVGAQVKSLAKLT